MHTKPKQSGSKQKYPFKMKDPSVCYIKKLIYKTRRHFHAHLWSFFQYIHNVFIVPDGNHISLERSMSGSTDHESSKSVYCTNYEKINK